MWTLKLTSCTASPTYHLACHRYVSTSAYFAYMNTVQRQKRERALYRRPSLYVGRRFAGLPPSEPVSSRIIEGWAKNEVVTEILSGLTSVEAVLQGSSGLQLQPEQVSSFLEKIGELCSDRGKSTSQEELENLMSDTRFTKLGEILHEKALTLKPGTLITSTACLVKLLPEDTFILQSLQLQLLWMLKRIPLSQVLRALKLYEEHQETELRKKLYSEALALTERRWVEITHPADLVTLFYMIDHYPNKMDFFSKLEDRALDLCTRMTPKEVYRVFYILGKHNKRNTPLLRALVYHLAKNLSHLNNVQLANLCYACATLNFFDDFLLVEIGSLLWMRLDKFELHLLTSILQSFSFLKWLKSELIEDMVEHLVTSDDLSPNHLVSVMLSCARLAYLPLALDRNLASVLTKVTPHLQPKVRLDVVWSLAVLKKLDASSAASVLSPEYLDQLKESDHLTSPVQLKLSNIAALAKGMNNYEGPMPPKDVLESFTYKVPLKQDHPGHEVVKVLSTMVPVEKYLRQFITTPNGYMIDIEMLINAQGEPQPIIDVPQPWEIMEPLPDNVYRIALKVFDYHDYTRFKVHPVGVHSLGCQLLETLGYHVVQIPFTEFNQQSSTVGKLKYIQTAVSSLINSLHRGKDGIQSATQFKPIKDLEASAAEPIKPQDTFTSSRKSLQSEKISSLSSQSKARTASETRSEKLTSQPSVVSDKETKTKEKAKPELLKKLDNIFSE